MISTRPLMTAPCEVLTNSVETSSIEKSDSDITESGSGHVAVNKNYVNNDSDGTESGSCPVEIKVNGVDKSDVIESGPCHVKIETDDVGKSDVFDSGSVRVNVKKISVNKCKEDGKAAVKLCKKTYIKSNAVSIEAKGRSEVVKDGPMTAQCADVEGRQINNSFTDNEVTALEQVEVCHESVGRTVRSAAVIRPAIAASPSEKSSETQSSSANDRVSSTPDGLSANTDNINIQAALSSSSSAKTKHRDDLAVRTPNRESAADKSDVVESGSSRVKVETGDVIDSGSVRVNVKKTKRRDDLAVSTANRVSAVDGKIIEQQTMNHRLMLRDLPTVHKEGSETDRPLPLSNCRLISTKLTSAAVHNEGVETDRQRQHANCQLPTVCNNSGEADQHTNCRLISDNLPKTCSMGIETDRSTNRQMLTVYSESGETGHHRQINSALSKDECKGGEIDRHVNCQLPAVQKCHMLVDCDVNLPQNVWTTVVNHNLLSSDDTTTHRAAHGMPNAASEVRCLIADCS